MRFPSHLLNRRLAVAFAMGFASGLPLLLSGSIMQARAMEAGASLSALGLFGLVGLPYTLKFLWAPVFDAFSIGAFGRRRGWLLVCQLLLMTSLILLAFFGPEGGTSALRLFVLLSLLLCFFSASQDTVIDAYRREDLAEIELGMGSSYYMYGYRLGMLAAGGGGLILADFLPWPCVYIIMAGGLVPSILLSLMIREPARAVAERLRFRDAVVRPFMEILQRRSAVALLLFILFFKVGDTLAGAVSTPFFMELGYSKAEIGSVAKIFGFWAILAGAFAGGAIIVKAGLQRSLWYFGLFQMVSTIGFSFLALADRSIFVLAAVISVENLASGMGNAAFLAFLASLTDKRFTAVQYALLTSLMGVPRVVISSFSGFMAEVYGWVLFFALCTLAAIPGLLLLKRLERTEAIPDLSQEA